MPWRRSERPQPPPTPLPVPDAEAVRRAALLASWQRDRRVAKRRLAWRWILWYAHQYRWYLLAFMGVLAWVGVSMVRQPVVRSAPQRPDAVSMPDARPSTPTQDVLVTAPSSDATPPLPAATLIPATTYAGLPDLDRAAVRLRPSATREPPPQVTSNASQLPVVGPDTSMTPSLIFENWLHSKEP